MPTTHERIIAVTDPLLTAVGVVCAVALVAPIPLGAFMWWIWALTSARFLAVLGTSPNRRHTLRNSKLELLTLVLPAVRVARVVRLLAPARRYAAALKTLRKFL